VELDVEPLLELDLLEHLDVLFHLQDLPRTCLIPAKLVDPAPVGLELAVASFRDDLGPSCTELATWEVTEPQAS
jgi:hypothetical protein